MHRGFHRAFAVEAILIVLDHGGDRLERERAVGLLHHVLQIEILDRDLVPATEMIERQFERIGRTAAPYAFTGLTVVDAIPRSCQVAWPLFICQTPVSPVLALRQRISSVPLP